MDNQTRFTIFLHLENLLLLYTWKNCKVWSHFLAIGSIDFGFCLQLVSLSLLEFVNFEIIHWCLFWEVDSSKLPQLFSTKRLFLRKVVNFASGNEICFNAQFLQFFSFFQNPGQTPKKHGEFFEAQLKNPYSLRDTFGVQGITCAFWKLKGRFFLWNHVQVTRRRKSIQWRQQLVLTFTPIVSFAKFVPCQYWSRGFSWQTRRGGRRRRRMKRYLAMLKKIFPISWLTRRLATAFPHVPKHGEHVMMWKKCWAPVRIQLGMQRQHKTWFERESLWGRPICSRRHSVWSFMFQNRRFLSSFTNLL